MDLKERSKLNTNGLNRCKYMRAERKFLGYTPPNIFAFSNPTLLSLLIVLLLPIIPFF